MKPNSPSFIRSIAAPEWFFILALLVFGGIACLALPISAGYDEETHFVRAWEMAHLYFIPNQQLGAKLPFPAIYWELSYRRQPIVAAVRPDLWAKYGSLKLDAHDYIYSNVVTRSVYSPVLLLPQALTIRYLGLSLQLPALAVYYATRFIGLLSYILLGWLALRLIPFGKWLLAILMVSPMALLQASSVSADTISNGIGFLFLGGSLWLASHEEIRWRQWLIGLGLIALLFTAKVNLLFLVLLPFLLIPPSRFRMRYGYWLLVAAGLALFAIEVAGWNVVAYSRFTRMLEGASPIDQVKYILSAPLQFARILAGDIWTNTPAYLQGWVGVYGYDYWPVPALAYVLYPLAVIAVLLSEPRADVYLPGSDRWRRGVLIGLFVLGCLLTIASLYVAFTPVGSQYVAGVQGRYFTPVMPLLLLALVGAFFRRGDPPRSAPEAKSERRGLGRPGAGVDSLPGSTSTSALSLWEIAKHPGAERREVGVRVGSLLALAALVLYVAGMLLSYHVPCGSQYYQRGLCYQPVYKNWAPAAASSPPVSSDMTLTQEIVPGCNDMTQLQLWVNSPGGDPNASTQVTLHASEGDRDVVSKSFHTADLPSGGWLTLDFPPESSSADHLYLITVSGTSPQGPRLGYSLKADYVQGKLHENGAAVSQDMLFQYGCVAGLQRILASSRIP